MKMVGGMNECGSRFQRELFAVIGDDNFAGVTINQLVKIMGLACKVKIFGIGIIVNPIDSIDANCLCDDKR